MSSPAHADELWIGSPGAGAIHIRNATINRIEAGQMFFLASGKEASRELERVQRILVDNEPALNAAEEALALEKWDEAVDGYQKTIRSTTRPWLKDWATTRLIEAASKSGRFDAAATAYIAMLLKDPASASGAKPAMPGERSTYLDQVVTEVNAALAKQNLTDEQRQALLTFLMDLHRARKDSAAEERIANQLDEILAKDPDNPAAGEAIARRKLMTAARALQARDYRTVVAEIDSAKSRFNDPRQQAEALFLLAEARAGLADPNKPETLKDAALAYMRVVAHFKNEPDKPRVAESLLKTAMICERLSEPDAAVVLYRQIVAQFPNDPAAAAAQQNLQRLGQQTGAR